MERFTSNKFRDEKSVLILIVMKDTHGGLNQLQASRLNKVLQS